LRKLIYSVEDVFHEGGPISEIPLRRAAALAIIENPFAGRYEPEIQGFMEDLKPLGLRMAQKLLDLLGGADKIEGYGKGAMIGEAGELEHGALWHAPGGYAMRALLADSNAIVPSTKKVTGVGGRLDVPITHINASYVRSHFDSMEVGTNDSPRANEMVLALVMSTGARIHNRAGGLAAADIIGKDGLR
jgi:hypothetical protein